jgi:hypothetical protein
VLSRLENRLWMRLTSRPAWRGCNYLRIDKVTAAGQNCVHVWAALPFVRCPEPRLHTGP